mmetsp:Transcript_50022/g.93555  ORF Transcript_50022/g.93555 Transcript_50022/m.93555 type:complete len:120 (+) Transcript_50022:81-440(+)
MSKPIPGSSAIAEDFDALCAVTPSILMAELVPGVPGESKVDADETSTVDTYVSDAEEKEEIDVRAWGAVGRKIFERLAADSDSDDDFQVSQKEPIDTHAWSSVGARIFETLAALDDEED